MTKPTRRDETWHAALVTASEQSIFGIDDVVDTGEDLGVDVTNRTARKVVSSMTTFGYVEKVNRGEWRIDPAVAVGFGSSLGGISGRLDE